MELFENAAQDRTFAEAPLAYRMRPRTLEEFVGQRHIIGQGKLLRRAIEADRFTSVIFYGPPGTGKTLLARAVATEIEAAFFYVKPSEIMTDDQARELIAKYSN